jgi:hypothetical protein
MENSLFPGFQKGQFDRIFFTEIFTLNSDPICQTLGVAGPQITIFDFNYH